MLEYSKAYSKHLNPPDILSQSWHFSEEELTEPSYSSCKGVTDGHLDLSKY